MIGTALLMLAAAAAVWAAISISRLGNLPEESDQT